MAAAAFRRLLEDGDYRALRTAWQRVAPHLPQPASDEQAEIIMHMARTSNEFVHIRKRAWSHRWLNERMLPSQLPDELKPEVDRLYPRIAEAVGISVKFSNPLMKPAADEIRQAMEHVVADAYAEGRTRPAFVKRRMQEAREKTLRALFGGSR